MPMPVWIVFGFSLLVLGVGSILGALHEAYQHRHINTYFTDVSIYGFLTCVINVIVSPVSNFVLKDEKSSFRLQL